MARTGRGIIARVQKAEALPADFAPFSAVAQGFGGFEDARQAQAQRLKAEKEEEVGPTPTPYKEFVPPESDKAYGSKPIFADQLEKFPTTVQFGAVQYAYFEIPTQIEELNKFRQQEEPKESPQILIDKEHEPEFIQTKTKGFWSVLLQFRRVYYKQIL